MAACIALASFAGLGGCETLTEIVSSVDKPTADVVGTSLRSFSLTSADLDFDVEISNPYAAALPLVNVDYQVGSRGSTLVSGSANLSGTIPARGSQVVTVPARFLFEDILRAVRDVRPGMLLPYDAELTLSLDAPGVGPVSLPIKHRGDLPIPAVPDVQVRQLSLDRVDFERIVGTLDLQVRNTNQFATSLTGMEYEFSLGGNPVIRSSLEQGLALEPGATGSLQIPVEFTPAQTGLAVLGILRGDEADLGLGGRMALDTPFGALNVPFEQRGAVPLRR